MKLGNNFKILCGLVLLSVNTASFADTDEFGQPLKTLPDTTLIKETPGSKKIDSDALNPKKVPRRTHKSPEPPNNNKAESSSQGSRDVSHPDQ
jgi:hypothetical protein